ncbi:MAG: Abi family protein [Propionibacteriaceae bacterium]|nr:Abi family protein [Propionibacteriaceae bacterium]
MLAQLRAVRFLRNRCAHHEPLIHGFPLPGQARRMGAVEGVETYMRVLDMLDRDLADWMVDDSAVGDIIAHRPHI